MVDRIDNLIAALRSARGPSGYGWRTTVAIGAVWALKEYAPEAYALLRPSFLIKLGPLNLNSHQCSLRALEINTEFEHLIDRLQASRSLAMTTWLMPWGSDVRQWIKNNPDRIERLRLRKQRAQEMVEMKERWDRFFGSLKYPQTPKQP